MTPRVAALWVLSLSGVAFAAPKSLAVATGDCRDAELLGSAAAFTDAVAGQLKADALEPAVVLERLRPRPAASLDEVQRQLDGAQSLFYGGSYEQAVEQVKSAVRSLERLRPDAAVAKRLVSARVLEGLILKAQNKKSEQLEAWRRVLRTSPDHQLDSDYHTPATIAQFEQLKRELQKVKRVPLSVTSTPPGATVFLDGMAVGKTPLKSSGFPAGEYQLTLVQGEAQSFVYEVKLADRPFELQIDLGFEGAVRPTLPICVSSADADALKLASRAGAEQALLLHTTEPGWVAAVLYDVPRGARVREGGMKLVAARAGGWADLASFVLTGQPAKLALNRPQDAPTYVPSPAASPPPALQVAQPSPAVAQPPAEVAATSGAASSSRVPRLVAGGVAVAGLGVAVAGLAYWLDHDKDRRDLGDSLTPEHEVCCGFPPEQVLALDAKVQSENATALALGIGGGAVAAAGAVLFFVLAPSDAPRVSALAGPGGGYVGVSGRF